MKRVIALAVMGLLAGGCGGEAPKNAPPANTEARRAALYKTIKESTPFKYVAWESVLAGVKVEHVSLREDSLFVEVIEKTNEHGRIGMPALYRLNTSTGTVDWIVDLPKPLDFRPSIVGAVVKNLAALVKERARLIDDREIERTRKQKDAAKIQSLTESIKQKTELIESIKLQDRVYAVSESDKLHIIERPAGAEFHRQRLAFSPSTAAAGSPSVVFLGALERNRLIGLDPNSWAEIIFFPADGDIKTTPIYADPGNVYFASEDGHVYGYTADGRSKLIDYRTEAPIVSDMFLDIETNEQGKETWGALLVGSTDYALYCFNRVTGELMWKYETGGQIRTAPQASGGVAYCLARDKGFHAIDKRTGKLLYNRADAWWMLCRGRDRVYLMGANNANIIAVEERTGKELSRCSTGEFKHICADPRGHVAYLVTEDGFVFAAKESDIDY